jgi:choline dehydrogenase-like flavoprotein
MWISQRSIEATLLPRNLVRCSFKSGKDYILNMIDHGTNGKLHLSYASKWEKGLEDVFQAAEQVGLGVNPDVNSGNPIGMGIGAACMYQGSRTTAAAYLEDAPSNLTIITNASVAKVLVTGKKATGIKTIDGREFTATKDVILSGGALNTPQLLMLSGIGPYEELNKHGIPIVHELPEVGQNLQDHCFSTATLLQKSGTNERMAFETNTQGLAAAKAQHAKDKTGLMAEMYCGTPMGWFKNEAVFNSEEFKALDKNIREHMNKPTVPVYEIATVSLLLPPICLELRLSYKNSMFHLSTQAATNSSPQTPTSPPWPLS